jgi:hypothetical protein
VLVVSIKPEEAEAHFGWLARFAGQDMLASSAHTQQKRHWKPTGPALVADLDGMGYTACLSCPSRFSVDSGEVADTLDLVNVQG